MKIIEPSLLSFNTSIIDTQLKEIKEAGASFIHYDVMDGIYVPNQAFGPEYLSNIAKCGLKTNVHMMVADPIKWINKFISHPMNSLTFHPEVYTNEDINRAFSILKAKGIKYGIALKMEVDANRYLDILKHCDFVCVMSVEPGKGGQLFNDKVFDNLRKVKSIKDQYNHKLVIQVDGGVNYEVMPKVSPYADNLITGSFLMKQTDKKAVFDFGKKL